MKRLALKRILANLNKRQISHIFPSNSERQLFLDRMLCSYNSFKSISIFSSDGLSTILDFSRTSCRSSVKRDRLQRTSPPLYFSSPA